ncbi:MAG: prepilin peptidase [Rickettsiales bacterium]
MLQQMPTPLLYGLVTIVGAAIGSFITLITYRLPRDEPVGMTRSRCPACFTTLGVRDLFPVLSWVLARGRCRHCQVKVSARYPLTELACALGGLFVVIHYGPTLEALAIAGLWWSIVALTVTDLENYIILDEVQISIGVFGVLYGYARNVDAADAAIAACAGAAIGLTLKYGFLYLRNKDGLGLGDVKFLFVAGVWLASAANFIPFLFYSGLMGIVFGTVWQRLTDNARFPFGPALAASLLLCVVSPQTAAGFWQLYGLLR